MKKLLLTIAWLWVAIPLGWGVYQSVQKSLPLFDGASKPAAMRETKRLLGSSATFAVQVGAIALDEGFEVNFRKTRIMRYSTRQFAAGIVLNRRTNIRRDEYDQLKATLYNCGNAQPATQNRESHADFRMHLLGKINWVKQLNPTRGAKLMKLFDKILWD